MASKNLVCFTKCNVHSTLHTTQCTVDTKCFVVIMHPGPCTPHTARYTPEDASWTRHTKGFAPHTEHCTPKNAPWTQHMAHCTPHTEPCTPTCLFTRLEGLAWSHQDFWQPSFCRNCYLGSLFFIGEKEFFYCFLDEREFVKRLGII